MSFRFQKFPIYINARKLINEIYNLCTTLPKIEEYVIINQLKRSAISILLNIAEGSMKKSDKEFRRYLLIDAGSISEIVAILDICLDQKYITSSTHKLFVLKCQSLITEIYAFSRSLNSAS